MQAPNPADQFWLLRDFDNTTLTVFKEKHIAMHNAEAACSNRAWANAHDVMLLGPGNGDTRFMLEPITREQALALDLPLPAEE